MRKTGSGITLEKLQVIIEAYTKPYREELEKVQKKTGQVTSKIERQVSKIGNSFRRLGGIIAGALSITALVAFGKSCIDLGSELIEVQNVVDVTFGEMSGHVNAFAKNAMTQFGLSETIAKKYTGTYGAMAKAFGITGEAGVQMSKSITGLTGDVASFYNLSTDEAYTKLKSIFTGETESLKDLGVVMTQTALDQYALNNGFGKTTAKMTEQEKVMLRYQFVMSSLSDASGDFQRTSGSWANQVRVLSLQFDSLRATIGQGLINAFTPMIRVINTVIAKLQVLAEYFRAFTAALFGNASGGGSSDPVTKAAGAMSSAAGSSGQVADNMGSAAKSAKELNRQLAAFDELNNLSAARGADGGGGGGGGSGVGEIPDFGDLDAALDAEMQKINDKVSELARRIADAFKTGDFKSLGLYISDQLTKALQSIRWESIYEVARNFGRGLADFLNGLITPDLFGEVGRTIASVLNASLYVALEFGKTFDWSNLGASIASGINNFFTTFDFAALGQSVSTFAIGLLSTLNRALGDVDWYHIGEQIGNFLANLDWEEILSKAGRAIILGLGAAIELYLGSLSVAPVETAIITGIAGFKFRGVGKAISNGIKAALAGGLNLGNISVAITGFAPLINSPAIAMISNWIIDGVDEFIAENFGKEISDAMGEAIWLAVNAGLGAYLGGPIGALIGAGIAAAIDTFVLKGDGITKFWNQIGSDLFNWNVAGSLWDSAKEFFDMAFKAENFGEFGMNIVEGIINGMAAAVVWVIEPIMDLFDTIRLGICDLFGIHSPAKKMEPYGQYILEGIIEGFKNTFTEWINTLTEWYEKYIEPWFTTQKWSELYNTIKTSLQAKWSEVVEWWKNSALAKWWNEQVSPWFTVEKWNNVMKGVPDAFKSTFQKAINAAIDKLNQFIDWANSHLSIEMPGISNPITGENITDAVSYQLFTIPHIPHFADGGYVESGQMFIAREAGPEMVGRIGSRTAVVNNEQITEGIRQAVVEGMLEIAPQLSGNDREVHIHLEGDAKGIFKIIRDADRRYFARTGQGAFAH